MRSFILFSASASRCSFVITLTIVAIILTGCGSSAFSPPPSTKVPLPAAATNAATTDVNGSVSTPPVLLFNGKGTISSDVAAVESILTTLGLKYATADSSQMDSMSESQLKAHKLLIVPGGNSITIGNNLSRNATTNIHNAVDGGLHYLGICAGAFFGGYSIYNGLNLTDGVWFNVYAGNTAQVMDVSFPGGTVYDIYYKDGPELSGWGSVVGKYPDGKPAITEGRFGNGWVILSGVHPEAPASWRYGMKFDTSLATDIAYATKLVRYALDGTSLPHF